MPSEQRMDIVPLRSPDISYLKEEKEEIIEIGRENLEFLLAHVK